MWRHTGCYAAVAENVLMMRSKDKDSFLCDVNEQLNGEQQIRTS